MKILIYSILLILSGCANTSHVINDIPKIQASNEIMLNCKEFIKPINWDMDELTNLIIKNKGIYESCNKLNNEKKEFILKQY